MPIVVLLLVGLVCLAVGLFLSSTTWLIFSLVASALAAFAGPPTHERRRRADRARDAAAPAVQAAPPAIDVWVVDGRPRYHREGCDIIAEQSAEAIPLGQASEDGFIPCSLCEPDRVDATKGA